MISSVTERFQSTQLSTKTNDLQYQQHFNPLWFLVPKGTKPEHIIKFSRRRFTLKSPPPINIKCIADINLFYLQEFSNQLLKQWYPLKCFSFENLAKSTANLAQIVRHTPSGEEEIFWKQLPYFLLMMSQTFNTEFIKELSAFPLKNRAYTLFLQYLAFILSQKDENNQSCISDYHLVFSREKGFEWKPTSEDKHYSSKAYRFFVLALCNFLEDGKTEFLHTFQVETNNTKEQIIVTSPITQIMDKLSTNKVFSKIIFNDLALRQIVCRFYLKSIVGQLFEQANGLTLFTLTQRKKLNYILNFLRDNQQKIVQKYLAKKESNSSVSSYLSHLSRDEKTRLIEELKINHWAISIENEPLFLELLLMIFTRPGSILCFDERRMISYQDYFDRVSKLDEIVTTRLIQFKRIGGLHLQKGHSEFVKDFFHKQTIEICYILDTFRAMMMNFFSIACSLLPESPKSKIEWENELSSLKTTAFQKDSFDWTVINSFLGKLVTQISLSEETPRP